TSAADARDRAFPAGKPDDHATAATRLHHRNPAARLDSGTRTARRGNTAGPASTPRALTVTCPTPPTRRPPHATSDGTATRSPDPAPRPPGTPPPAPQPPARRQLTRRDAGAIPTPVRRTPCPEDATSSHRRKRPSAVLQLNFRRTSSSTEYSWRPPRCTIAPGGPPIQPGR